LICGSIPSHKTSSGIAIFSFFGSIDQLSEYKKSSAFGLEFESCVSSQAIDFNNISASSTLFVITHTWSKLDAMDWTPYLDIIPYVGLSHTIPHKAAGCLTLHHVSVPSAAIQQSDATATADQPLDHHDTRSLPYGLIHGPNAEFSLDHHIAYSSILVFHIISHQFFSRFRKHVALYGDI
jgi:hypothetical protein